MELLRFSTAMRLGAMLAPQAFRIDRSAEGGTCAAQAAADATGLEESWSELWPWLASPGAPACPVCSMTQLLPITLVVHLNDEHRWTREQIADVVEQIERARGLWPVEEAEPVMECVR